MRSFLLYTLFGTLATFGLLVYLSLLPHFAKLPGFAGGFTPEALLSQWSAFLMTLGLSWVAWVSVYGLLSLILYLLGKCTAILLFFLSLIATAGIALAIT